MGRLRAPFLLTNPVLEDFLPSPKWLPVLFFPKCHQWTWRCNMEFLGSYTVCRKWLTVKDQKAANRINIPPWDLTPPGRTAPLPLFLFLQTGCCHGTAHTLSPHEALTPTLVCVCACVWVSLDLFWCLCILSTFLSNGCYQCCSL